MQKEAVINGERGAFDLHVFPARGHERVAPRKRASRSQRKVHAVSPLDNLDAARQNIGVDALDRPRRRSGDVDRDAAPAAHHGLVDAARYVEIKRRNERLKREKAPRQIEGNGHSRHGVEPQIEHRAERDEERCKGDKEVRELLCLHGWISVRAAFP